ncbi:triose-phosphate isomerase [Polynucleobacter kasalickyi]|uniref:Triosephosphate isomerase n=1 Tax=Polynucleobacter kasalickyi TaxID=1938817 RepID=A0A1W1ZTU8_9BURK|nr:triose-phosphate isomerase [Polynucleobacter kasalickyi]SMC51824.1 triosephosphate isomerase [Polynucleobacter kasalickyi]
MRNRLIVANWKLNGNWAFNEMMISELSAGLGGVQSHDHEIILCPPAIYLQQLNGLMGDIPLLLGGQDLSEHFFGAYTGEVSGQMLKELGCRYTLVGHSERRARHQESNELVALKAKAALACGLIPIICVGETLEERESGKMNAVIQRQIQSVMECLEDDISQVVIAYEPIWAIGTGLTAKVEQAQEVHEFIRGVLREYSELSAQKISVIYGGSVKAANAPILLEMPDIDGLLVGGASLLSSEFLAICLSSLNSK